MCVDGVSVSCSLADGSAEVRALLASKFQILDASSGAQLDGESAQIPTRYVSLRRSPWGLS